MKVGDLVDFADNKGNKGTGIVKRIRDVTTLDLDVKRRNGRFQLFLSVPKASKKKRVAHWSPIEKEVIEKKKESFKKSTAFVESETFSSQPDW